MKNQISDLLPSTRAGYTLQAAHTPLARPGCHPDPIDRHAAVGGLIEAFEEVLDLGLHSSSRMASAVRSTSIITAGVVSWLAIGEVCQGERY